MTEGQWREALVRYLKGQMRERGLNFADVAQQLARPGGAADRTWLTNKVNRGSFSAGFLMQLLEVLGCQSDWRREVCRDLPASQGQQAIAAASQPSKD